MFAYCPPTSGRRCASSAYTNAPASAIIPPTIHTPIIRDGAVRCCATTAGLRNIPAPTIPPITIIVASKTPRRLESPASLVIKHSFDPRHDKRRDAVADHVHDRARLAHETIDTEHDGQSLNGNRLRCGESARQHDESGSRHARGALRGQHENREQ